MIHSLYLMLNLKQIQTFKHWQSSGKGIVVGTVFKTAGSTYSKQGKVILINEDGDHIGLVSGGCLEEDIISHGLQCLASGECSVLCYDLRTEESELWGLGAGCRGLINLFLQPLHGFHLDLLETLIDSISRGVEGELITYAGIDHADVAAGTSTFITKEREYSFGLNETHINNLKSYICGRKNVENLIISEIDRIPNVLILGAGLDAVPIVEFTYQLGWKVTVADYRGSYFDRKDLELARTCLLENRDAIEKNLNLNDYNVVVIMSHNLEADRTFVSQLKHHRFDYLGILGPLSRKQMILEKLAESESSSQLKIIGPVGLDIGADSPESIALALLAEIHQKLKKSTKK